MKVCINLLLQGYDSVKIFTEASANSGEDVWGQNLLGLNLTRSHLSSTRLLSFQVQPSV